MIKTFAIAACAALVAAAAPAEAGHRWNGLTLNGLTLNGAAQHIASATKCVPSSGGGCWIIVNGLTLNGLTLNGLTLNGVEQNHAGGAVCSRITNACWINNGVALNTGSVFDEAWKVPDATETAPVSRPTVQRLDPLAVRMADGTLVSLAEATTTRPPGGAGFVNNGSALNGVSRETRVLETAPERPTGGGGFINNSPQLNGVQPVKPKVERYGETSSRGGGDWIINGPLLNGGNWALGDGSIRTIRP